MSIERLSTWTFGGISFAVRADSDTWDLSFEETSITQIDPILDTDQSYVDIGGTQYTPLTKRAAFANAADRTSMLNKRGQVATLTNMQGQERQALLSKVKPLGSGEGYFWAELTWNAV